MPLCAEAGVLDAACIARHLGNCVDNPPHATPNTDSGCVDDHDGWRKFEQSYNELYIDQVAVQIPKDSDLVYHKAIFTAHVLCGVDCGLHRHMRWPHLASLTVSAGQAAHPSAWQVGWCMVVRTTLTMPQRSRGG